MGRKHRDGYARANRNTFDIHVERDKGQSPDDDQGASRREPYRRPGPGSYPSKSI